MTVSSVVREHVTHVVRPDEAGAAGDEDLAAAHVRKPQRGRRASGRSCAGRVLLVAGRERRVRHAPVGRDRGIVPRHAELVVRVVVAVDEVGDHHVAQRGEAVRDARRDEHAAVVERAVGALTEVEHEGAAVGGRALAEVVEHDPGASHRDVPVVGLVQVVVQPDDRAGLAVAAVALDHLATLREPLAPVRLDEDAALVAVDRGLDDVDAVDDVGRDDVSHQTCSISIRRARPGSGRRRGAASRRASPRNG